MAEKERMKIKQRQREGINAAKIKGKHLGRPKKKLPENWNDIYNSWKKNEISSVKAMKLLNYSSTTFYRKIKEFEKEK